MMPPVSAQTIINWVKAGKLKATRLGSGPRWVSVQSLLEFMKANGAEVPEVLK